MLREMAYCFIHNHYPQETTRDKGNSKKRGQEMNYHLIKNGEVVGEAMSFKNGMVYYTLFKDIRTTRTSTLERIKLKFKLKEIN